MSQYATWRSEHTAIPRTPHSARHQAQDIVDMLDSQQTEPLLQSSKDAVFPQHELDYQYDYNSKATKSKSKRPAPGLILGSIAAAVLLVLLALSLWKPSILHEYVVGENGELLVVVEDGTEPDEGLVQLEAVARPAPAKVGGDMHSDHDGHANVIDYSAYTSFPLTPIQYDEQCWKLHQGPHRHAGYWAVSPEHGLLDVAHHTSNPRVCSSSITYMLDGGVGLAADLAYMAQIAGLARERNRTFFVMDKWWNRGRWGDYFEDVHKTQLGPEPGCLPPPPEEYVACPRIARHWIIGSRTAKFHMSHEFMDAFEDPFKMDLERQRPMFDRALDSLRDTIKPNAALRALIAKARRSVSNVAYAGVHLRRGDQLARTWKYRKGYVPISEFVTGIRGVEGGVSAVWAASDAPAAITELGEELGHNVQVLNLTSVGGDVGRLMPNAEDAGYVQKEWRYRTEEERKRLTRGAVVDFAMISGLWLESGQRAPSASVCTYGSNICRLGAIGLGWERAFNEKRWVDVDAKGTLAPIWAAFNLFG